MCLWDTGSCEWGSSLSPKIIASLGALTHDPAWTILIPGMLWKKNVKISLKLTYTWLITKVLFTLKNCRPKNSMHITTDIPHFWRQTGQNILQKLENLEKKSWIINSLYQILALSEEIKMGSTPEQLQLNSIFWLEGLSMTESEKQVRRDLNLSAPE